MYLIGRIADQTDTSSHNGLVEISGLRSLVKGVLAFKSAIAANYGGAPADYDVFEVVSASDEARIQNGDEFFLFWTSDTISGVDFSVEDAKRIVDFIPSKERISGDGIDESVITITVYQSDGVTVDTAVTASKVWPILKDGKAVNTRFTVTNGVGTVTVKRSEGGTFQIPSGKRLDSGNIRVRSIANIDVLEMFS